MVYIVLKISNNKSWKIILLSKLYYIDLKNVLDENTIISFRLTKKQIQEYFFLPTKQVYSTLVFLNFSNSVVIYCNKV